MKLLVINPFGVGTYDHTILSVCTKAKRSDTELVVEHLSRGLPFIRHAYFQSFYVPDVVERIIQADKQDFDGVFVSCCFEPGVKEAREVVDIPVVGGSAPAVFLARQLGNRFGFITDTERANVITYDLFKQCKLDVECVGIRSVDMGVEQIDKEPGKNQARVIEVASRLVGDGADVIINGCTVVAAYFNTDKLPSSLKGIPVLDSNVCALKTLEMLVDLHKTYDVTVSRRYCYQKPQDIEPAAFQNIRKEWGLPVAKEQEALFKV